MRVIFGAILGVALAVASVPAPVAAETLVAQGTQSFEKAPLTIRTQGRDLRFTVELALTPAQMQQGLMYRRNLASDAGMLFLHPQEQELAMWMANTLIPLDMLFIKADGRIHRIQERAVPLSETTISSGGRVKAVLELQGGSAARLGIKPGDLVVYPGLGTP